MAYVLTVYQIDNYITWKKIFDQSAKVRYVAGEISFQILNSRTEPSKIIQYSSWRSLEQARTFFKSKESAEILRKACAQARDITYLELLDRGTLWS